MLSDMDNISSFLFFGYLPLLPEDVLLQSWARNPVRDHNLQSASTRDLVVRGAQVLKSVFENTSAEICRGLNVVPLSGGLDSRAILAGLLENIDSKNILAVTFGTPGTWDFEIGRNVARIAGVRSELIDLSSHAWKWDTSKFVKVAVQTAGVIKLFSAYVNYQIPNQFGTECVYWSGFMGDPLSGSHLLNKDSTTWEQAKSLFATRNRYCRSLKLTSPAFEVMKFLPPTPFLDSKFLSYDEQIDFGIRQLCFIRHIVLPRGYEYRTPFLQPDWVDFILNVPRHYRQHQYLYKEILKSAYPKLFSLPTKTNAGLPLSASLWQRCIRSGTLRMHKVARRLLGINWGVPPGINYIDFDRGLRERDDLKSSVYESIQDLKKRQVVDWIDIDKIWNSHQRCMGNYADALMLLSSLEINLKQSNSDG